jgi:tetratricopeptide (TPR) repeat protein
MTAANIANSAVGLAALIEGGTVAFVGRLGDVSDAQLQEAVETLGGRLVPSRAGEPVDVLVIGEGELPLTVEGDPALPLPRSAQTRVVSEGDFLRELRLATDEEGPVRLFALEALAELLHEPLAKVKAWYQAGLIRPAIIQHGIPRFEFRQVSAARMLARLTASGVTVGKLRQSLDRLKKWLPDVRQPLEQLDVLERAGKLLVRLEEGDVAELDGQLQLDYDAEEGPEPVQLRLVPGPRSAEDFHEQGVDQERHGLLEEAEDSYRRALRAGGPDAAACFDLAHVLQSQGKQLQALERYLQVVELDPRHVDGWNNLGVVLADLERHEMAVEAFREALKVDPQSSRAHYNLADALETLGQRARALEHWRAYLKLAPGPDIWSDHARRRVAGA